MRSMCWASRETPRFMDDPDYSMIDAEETAGFVRFNYWRAPFDNPDFRRAMGWPSTRMPSWQVRMRAMPRSTTTPTRLARL